MAEISAFFMWQRASRVTEQGIFSWHGQCKAQVYEILVEEKKGNIQAYKVRNLCQVPDTFQHRLYLFK